MAVESSKFHPLALSKRGPSSSTWNAVMGSTSSPPSVRGRHSRYNSASDTDRLRDGIGLAPFEFRIHRVCAKDRLDLVDGIKQCWHD